VWYVIDRCNFPARRWSPMPVLNGPEVAYGNFVDAANTVTGR